MNGPCRRGHEAARRRAHLGEREACARSQPAPGRRRARRSRASAQRGGASGKGSPLRSRSCRAGRARGTSPPCLARRASGRAGSGGAARAGRGTLPSVDARAVRATVPGAARPHIPPMVDPSRSIIRADGYPPPMVSTARVRAPELEGAGGFIGTAGPLTLASLRGRVVLLDFWTQACINCLHVLEEIRDARAAVRRRPARDRRSTRRSSRTSTSHEAVERAVERLGIDHPVLDDPDLRTWSAYAVQAWPTLVLIDPEGYIAHQVSGEGHVGLPRAGDRDAARRRTGQRGRSCAARCPSCRARRRRAPGCASPARSRTTPSAA